MNRRVRVVALLAFLMAGFPPAVGAGPAAAAPGPVASPSPRPAAPSARSAAPMLSLSIQDAIRRAIQNNLDARLARAQTEEARGRAVADAAGMLPHLMTTIRQSNSTENLAGLGFQKGVFPFSPPLIIGPYNTFDARIQLVQSVFNLSALRRSQAGRLDVELYRLREDLARDQVAAAAALRYVQAARAESAVDAARANFVLAQALLTLARNQMKAGIAAGIDVVRADTRSEERRLALEQATLAATRARLDLLRIVGLPLGSDLVLRDRLAYVAQPSPPLPSALAEAEAQRAEVRVARKQVDVAEKNREAARAGYLPSLNFVADYGLSGVTPTQQDASTRNFSLQMAVPVFDGGVTRGNVMVAEGQKREAVLRVDDVSQQVEEDVRVALQMLATAVEQVRTAEREVNLAERQLKMARDRFAAGIADNTEVLNAQTALAQARDNQVAALEQYDDARINLASALGHVQEFHI